MGKSHVRLNRGYRFGDFEHVGWSYSKVLERDGGRLVSEGKLKQDRKV